MDAGAPWLLMAPLFWPPYTSGAWILPAAYRKVCLESHPDKAGAGVTDEAEKEKIDKYFLQVLKSDALVHAEYATALF